MTYCSWHHIQFIYLQGLCGVFSMVRVLVLLSSCKFQGRTHEAKVKAKDFNIGELSSRPRTYP